VRIAAGYTTGSFYDFNAYAQLEDVEVIGSQSFNDGGTNGVTDRAVVADAQGAELKQAFLRYGGIPKTVVTAGRQEITHRDAPLQRFLSNLAFRQHWQTYDAVRIVNLSFPHTIVDYAYIGNVHRVFGRRNPLPDASTFPMNSHALDIQYSGYPAGRLEAYTYLLDFSSTVSKRFSTATYGFRFEGESATDAKLRLLYAAEFARQQDYAGNPNDIRVNYYETDLGLSRTFGGWLEFASVKLSYEFLGGFGGVKAFQTPLGNNHAYQGAADRFLVTPGDGIRDLFLTVTLRIAGFQFIAANHRFTSDNAGYEYGREWDLALERPLGGNFLIGLQYANYRADRNALNVARNSASGQAFDLTKFWAYLQYKY
jgi:hypothetical protein